MGITIEMPETYTPEREYVMQVVFGVFLCIEYHIEYACCEAVTLKLPNGKSIVLIDSLFGVDESIWLTEHALPEMPLSLFDAGKFHTAYSASDPVLPVIYGDPCVNMDEHKDTVECRIDIFGSIFFMLSRYEEYVLANRDIHDRFPGRESLAFRAGFIEKPIVNCYLELLWFLLKIQCSSLERNQHHFTMSPTHDVDRPFEYYLLSLQRAMRVAAADVLRRRSIGLAVSNVYQWGKAKVTSGVQDVNNTFDYLMDESEKRELVSSFYFLAGTGEQEPCFDRPYKISHPAIARLMTDINDRGHEIGLHTSYDTYLSEDQTCAEMRRLASQCKELNISQAIWGGRQHYLRWRNPDTQRNLDACGLDYDSTMGFADLAGFRSGTCYEYPLYDMIARKTLKLRERPLIAMDSVILAGVKEQRRTIDDCYDELCRLKKRCQEYGGVFTLLWHNSNLGSSEYQRLYEAVLDA